MKANYLCCMLAVIFSLRIAAIAEERATQIRTQSFDHDPRWEGVHNRMEKRPSAVVQNFGYSKTHYAGKEVGEMGGQIQRSTLPAYYADQIAVKTLRDKLSASGTFAVTDRGHCSVDFGWFNSKQPGGGRPMASLGLNLGFDRHGGILSIRLITCDNQSCGLPITPVIKPKPRGENVGLRRTLHNDGTRYKWKLDYDPNGAQGHGQMVFTTHSEGAPQKELDGKVFTQELPPGFKESNTTFDRFGLINIGKSGGNMSIYFDDLTYDGKSEDFTKDPGWIGSGNRGEFHEDAQSGVSDFGFSEQTHFAGGQAGEIGGTFCRGERARASYADRIGPLTLADRLEASGKVQMIVGAPDSGMYFGWFDSASRTQTNAASNHNPNFLGISVAGPTRVGHYFAPAYTTAKDSHARASSAPILRPGKVYNWSLTYDPKGADGNGEIKTTLGTESVTYPLRRGDKAEGATFDRFGFFTEGHGGQMIRAYFDDLKYTAASANQK